ncbi:MAG TPA: bifunctional UDP-sugar hydrolase/5'-nucleotidase [Kiritimatiellia bacterium]|jgi:5'-nucleotidase
MSPSRSPSLFSSSSSSSSSCSNRTLKTLASICALVLAFAISAEARLVEIRILHTTDLHGHILPTRDYEGNANVGGLLRCATLIRQLRAERENVLLVDCGDLYQGSAESYLSSGRVMIKAIDALKYDAWTLGNHEFDWGYEKLVPLQDTTHVPVLAANIVALPGNRMPLAKTKSFIMREFDGVRVAIVGLITPGVPSWSWPDLLGPLEFQRSVDALRRVMPQVRSAGPDIIVLTTHQGYRPHGDDHANEINAIARAFPEINIIIGGHSHRVEEGEEIGDTLYAQAGYYGIWLGCLDLSYDTVEKKLVNRTSRVLPVADLYEPDKELEALVHDDLEKARAYLDEEIGEAKVAITAEADSQGRSDIQQLLCKAIAEVSGAEMVLHSALSEDPLPAGPLRMRDVWPVVPYENRMAVLMLTSAELKEILDENLGNKGNYQFMGTYGLDYDVEKEGSKSRATRLRLPDGEPLHPRKRFRVAINSYVLASGGRRFPRLREIAEQPESRLGLKNIDTRNAVVEYIRKHSPLTAGVPAP